MWFTTASRGSIGDTEIEEPSVTTLANDADKLRQLDLGRSQAWQVYSDRLSGLNGDEYELAEADCWDELQRELRRIERKRKLLGAATA